jgi:hypothetical protein
MIIHKSNKRFSILYEIFEEISGVKIERNFKTY